MKGTGYLIQASLIALWWIGLFVNQDIYEAFQFPEFSTTAFNSFLLPDLTVVAMLSLLRAYTDREELGYIILGGFAFATLYCVNITILTGGGYLGTSLMLLGLGYNVFLIFNKRLFRNSSTDSVWINGLKTFVQIICVWTITLVLFPILLLNAFGEDIRLVEEYQFIGISLFVIFSLFGLYSAFVFVLHGKGTPLPLDQTQKLVAVGPYKYVRNPMAIGGLGQGIAVSLLVASVPVFIYTLLGAILWQLVVRPIEEKDMQRRFGEEYEQYKKRVSCWIPRFGGKD